MTWIFMVALQIIFIAAGIRREQKSGLWSWSKFVFILGFAGLEVVLVSVPAWTLDPHTPLIWWIIGAGWVIGALNFIWFIIVCRRWKLPDGRTSLQAERDAQLK